MPTLVWFVVIAAAAIHLSTISVAADPLVVVGGMAWFDTGDAPAYIFRTAPDGR